MIYGLPIMLKNDSMFSFLGKILKILIYFCARSLIVYVNFMIVIFCFFSYRSKFWDFEDLSPIYHLLFDFSFFDWLFVFFAIKTYRILKTFQFYSIVKFFNIVAIFKHVPGKENFLFPRSSISYFPNILFIMKCSIFT